MARIFLYCFNFVRQSSEVSSESQLTFGEKSVKISLVKGHLKTGKAKNNLISKCDVDVFFRLTTYNSSACGSSLLKK